MKLDTKTTAILSETAAILHQIKTQDLSLADTHTLIDELIEALMKTTIKETANPRNHEHKYSCNPKYGDLVLWPNMVKLKRAIDRKDACIQC